jgi:hypothetical protein
VIARVLAVLAIACIASPARADAEIGASLGYALPLGSVERGARTSDATFGLARIALDAGWRFNDRIGVAIGAAYGAGIPTLCATSGDCIASLGSDVVLSVRARYFLPRVSSMAPRIDAGIGYEWWTLRLADNGTTSTQSFHGPLGILEAAAPFAIGKRWSIGPALGVELGSFTSHRIESGTLDVAATTEHAMHAWLFGAVRAGFEF